MAVCTAVALLGCSSPGSVAEAIPPVAPAPAVEVDASDEAWVERDDAESTEATVQLEPWMMEAAKKIAAHNRGKTRAWARLALMVDTYGPRLSGSKALEDAIDWTLETMTADGLANVRRESVMVPHWVRGEESLQLVEPVKQDLIMIGLGMSVGTRRPLTAEVAVVDHVDAIAKQPEGAFDKKIVLINQVMPPYDDQHHDAHYGETVQARSRGPSEAAKKGAVGVLIRSVTAHSLRTPHTGMTSYEEGVSKIPAAAVTPADAERLARLVARGGAKVRLKMGAKTLPDAKSANAIAELRGREKPEEVVVIGGHIDSWDVGDGSSDDGAGCLMAMEAALMLRELGLVPRRTIRVVLFTNEENGLRGAKAYFDAHKDEKHVGAIEADSGSGAPFGFSIKASNDEDLKMVQSWAPLFEEIGASNMRAGWGGADISPLTDAGVLGLALWPDTRHYFDLHHSPADTIDKIDPDHLQRNAAAMALMAYLLAERE